MDSDDMVELKLNDHGYLVEDDAYVVNEDVLIDQEDNNSDSNCGGRYAPLREQDRFLPIANIAKIMKRAIPENGKIAKDARECVQECISEFISFITSEASDRCQIEKRKTINGEDVLFALKSLGFDNYVEPLQLYLKKYREMVSPSISTITKPHKHEGYGEDALYEQVHQANKIQAETAVIINYPKIIGDYTDI